MYDPNIAALILFGSFVILILIRVPIAFTLVISAIFSAAYMHLPIAVLAQQMKTGIQSMSLLTIPLFIHGSTPRI